MVLLFSFIAMIAAQTPANWSQKSPQTSPPPRNDSFAMAYDSVRKQTVMVGENYGTALLETWIWDGINWTQKIPGRSPTPRSRHAMAFDTARGELVLFGGLALTGAILNDTWVWDGSTWTQKTPAASPPAEYSMAMAYDSAHGQIVMFASDTWLWDGSNWTQKSSPSKPSARRLSSMAYDSAHGQVVLFGGGSYDFTSLLQDTWLWDGSNWAFKPQANLPPARDSYAMAYDPVRQQVVMFGGTDRIYCTSNCTVFNDTWIWDGSSWNRKVTGSSPSPRAATAMSYDPARDQIVLFGGFSGTSTLLNDTWTWNGGPAASIPSIGSVTSASAFGGFPSVAPGSWIEIYGSNLSSTTRSWSGADFSGNNAPNVLDGVQVTAGGQKAFAYYIAANPGQINALLPSNIGTGPQQLTVTNANGTSAPFNVTVNATQPGLLAPAAFRLGGHQYVVAQFADGSYVLPAGSIPGVNSRPARPGETVVIYGIGFGPVIPNISAGQIATEANQISAPLRISFGQMTAQMPYFGLAPSFVGLYQFNVVVPAVPDSDLVPLTFSLGGAAGAQTLYTAVHQ